MASENGSNVQLAKVSQEMRAVADSMDGQPVDAGMSLNFVAARNAEMAMLQVAKKPTAALLQAKGEVPKGHVAEMLKTARADADDAEAMIAQGKAMAMATSQAPQEQKA